MPTGVIGGLEVAAVSSGLTLLVTQVTNFFQYKRDQTKADVQYQRDIEKEQRRYQQEQELSKLQHQQEQEKAAIQYQREQERAEWQHQIDNKKENYKKFATLYEDIHTAINLMLPRIRNNNSLDESETQITTFNGRLILVAPQAIVTQYGVVSELLFLWAKNYWNANHRETPQFSDDKNGRVHAEMYAMTISKHRDSEKEVRPKLAGEIGTLSALMTAHLSTLEP